jgi:microtubule-associated protein-like 1/2
VVQWDINSSKVEVETVIPEQYGPVRTITEGRGSQLIVGTTKNSILAGSFQLPFQLIVHGHTDELWGLAVNPEQQQFITGGHDKMLILWDALSHTAVWSVDFDEAIQSTCFSPDGSIIIVGTTLGHWFAVSATTREIISHHNDGSEPIQVVRFSPDGKMLAIGSRDNVIYIYQASDNYQKYNRIGRCSGHSSFITHFDWSADSTFLQSNSGDYEVLFWNASVCRQIPQTSQLRDTEWATTTCTLTALTLGVWPESADGTDVNASDRSHDKKLLATGDDFGKVKLFSFPVTQPKSLSHVYGGHSSHVTNVQFLPDDTRLISCGGKDSSVMQWVIC